MNDSITRAYTPILRVLDHRLYLEALPHSQRPSERVYWIRFRAADRARPKLTTLDGAIAGLRRAAHLHPNASVGPGPWIIEYLQAWHWKSKLAIALHDLALAAKPASMSPSLD